MTLHHRTTSNSVRIAIPTSPPVEQQQPQRDRVGHYPQGIERQESQQERYSHAKTSSIAQDRYKRGFWQERPTTSQAQARSISSSVRSTFSVRVTRRQIAILLGSILAIIIVLRQTGSAGSSYLNAKSHQGANDQKPKKSGKGSQQKSALTPDGVPIVDKKVFERIRQLEAEAGYEDEDEYEARSAGRLPVKYNHKIPTVLTIPDGKPRNRPKVTEQDLESYRLANVRDAALVDQEYCPSQPDGCKFLLPAWLGEQETKAQGHLYQLGLLAISLNRTLVLPNVSKSRMMTCGSRPFEFYYDATSLDRLGIPTISFQRFSEWSSYRKEVPTAQIVAVTNPSNDWSSGALEVDPAIDPSLIPSLPKRKLCLEPPKAYLNFTSYSPITVYPPSNWHKQLDTRYKFGESLINTLTSVTVRQRAFRAYDKKGGLLRWFSASSSLSENEPSTSDVLVFNYELRYPILRREQLESIITDSSYSTSHLDVTAVQDFHHFPYAPVWTDLAKQVVASLSPFIAIHWRQETLPSTIIEPCGTALIDTLEEMLTQHGEQYKDIKTVYLATDYPIEDLENGWDGAVAHSGTFGRLLTEEHHSAMRSFLRLFRTRLTEPLGVRLTSFSKEQESLKLSRELLEAINPPDTTRSSANDRNGRPRQKLQSKTPPGGLDLAELDIGLFGIIDKTVAMHAEVFITGLPWSSDKKTQAQACAKESSFTKQISEARRLARSKTSLGSETLDQVTGRSLWSRPITWTVKMLHY